MGEMMLEQEVSDDEWSEGEDEEEMAEVEIE